MVYIEKSIHGGAVTFKSASGRFPAGLDITLGRTSVTIRNRKTLNELLQSLEGMQAHLAELENE